MSSVNYLVINGLSEINRIIGNIGIGEGAVSVHQSTKIDASLVGNTIVVGSSTGSAINILSTSLRRR